MQYFTPALWRGINASGSPERDQVSRQSWQQWEANLQAYRQQLATLQPRLDPQSYGFFTEINLHDSWLLGFRCGDSIQPNAPNEPFVELAVLEAAQEQQYILTYHTLQRVRFDYPTEQPLFYQEGGAIGDWGYDELTAADDHYLRHEILFSSGTGILIEFQQFNHHTSPYLRPERAG